MNRENTLIASPSELASLADCLVSKLPQCLDPLVEGNWIEIRQMEGNTNAYIVNDQVARVR